VANYMISRRNCCEKIQGITDGLLLATPKSIESRIDEIRTFVASGLKDLRDLLRKDTALARTELLKALKRDHDDAPSRLGPAFLCCRSLLSELAENSARTYPE
jgi:hypothetical protein